MSKISIIVPAYNCEDTIIKCLSSIINQGWEDFEVIVIDDGSSDNTLDMCRRYSEEHSGICVLEQKHAGPSKARNKGLRNSKGAYIAFCDADDELLPSALSSMMSRFEDGVDLVVGNVYKRNSHIFSQDVRLTQNEALNRFFRHDNERLLGSVYGKLFKHSIIAPLRSDLLTFNENILIGEDALFVMHYLRRCKEIQLCHDFVYVHAHNPKGIISSSQLKDYYSALSASKLMIKALSNHTDLTNLAINDLYWVFLKILNRISSTSDAELFKVELIKIIESLHIDYKFVNIKKTIVGTVPVPVCVNICDCFNNLEKEDDHE